MTSNALMILKCLASERLPCRAQNERLLGANGASDLDDGWAGSDGVVVDGVVAGSQDSVGLAGKALGDLDGETTADGSGGNEGRAGNGNESSVDGATGRGNEVVAGGVDGDGRAGVDGASGADGKGRESLDGESSVAGWAALDEGSSQGVDLVEVERSVKWLREGRLGLRSADVGAVAGLDSQDGASGGQVVGVGNGLGSTKVGAHTDTLEDVGGGQEAVDIGVAEVVCAFCDSLGTGG